MKANITEIRRGYYEQVYKVNSLKKDIIKVHTRRNRCFHIPIAIKEIKIIIKIILIKKMSGSDKIYQTHKEEIA